MRGGLKGKIILISTFTVIIFLNFTPSFAESMYHGTGTMTGASTPLDETISIGDPFEIILFYPDNPTDSANEDNFIGTYANSTLGFNLNNIISANSETCHISVSQNRTAGDPDSVSVFCDDPPFNPGMIGDAVFNSFAVLMVDEDGLVLTSDNLPQNLAALDSFWETQLVVLTYNATITVQNMEIPIVASMTGDFTSSVDTDKDGIIDFWEINGIDYDLDGDIDLNFPSLGADPMHKDLFLEIDYMAMHKPANKAVNDVKEAFANAPNNLVDNPDGKDGINLHIQVDDMMPHQNNTVMWSDFVSLKNTYFGTSNERTDDSKIKAKKLFYRYSTVIHNMMNDTASGVAELAGNDLILALGRYTNGTGEHDAGPASHQSAVLMHELGHTLNLHHGGQDEFNCKPNYLSIMSYTFTYTDVVPSRSLDYSREKNPTLVENNLDETLGIPGPSGKLTLVGGVQTPYNGTQFAVPFDFDYNGNTTDTGVSRNINLFADWCDGDGDVLEGFSDWDNILYSFRDTAEFADSVHPSLADTIDEMSQDEVEEMAASIYPFWCIPPESGDWDITESCEIFGNLTTPASIIIQNNSLVTINSGAILTVPSGENIIVVDGSGLKLIHGSSLNVLS